jgi:hypothetical protein
MAAATGAMKRHGRKQKAVTTAVSPVRPPILIPEMLSTYAVPDEVPNRPAPRVANASTIRPWRRFLGSPLSSTRFDACATPMSVESESNRSVIITVTMAGSSASCSAPHRSSFRNTDEKSGELNHVAGGRT